MTELDSLETISAMCRHRVELALNAYLPPAETEPQALHEAMRYTALSGGKYIRPLLVYCSGRACGVPMGHLDVAACAVELIHSYSLIHDDLPAMDDDAMRRGKPSCHIVYGDAMAVLAGDALQSLAFHILAREQAEIGVQQRMRMIDTLSYASGSLGMAGGQAIDLEMVGGQPDIDELENMHMRKTGALIQASILMGGLASDTGNEERLLHLGSFGRCIGLAFQIRDDILDIEADTETLGKPQGSDVAQGKPTYPSLLGLEGAHETLRAVHDRALACLDALGEDASCLRQLADYIIGRSS